MYIHLYCVNIKSKMHKLGKLKYWLIMLLLCYCSVHTIAQNLIPDVKNIKLGDQTVQLMIYNKPGMDITYIHVHENEEASLAAGLSMLDKHGGKLITLAHSTDGSRNRNKTFTYQKTVYKFDPNRIYTSDKNVLKNSIIVEKGRGQVDDIVIKMVSDLSKAIWDEVDDKSFILALHNNKNTPASFKIKWLFWKDVEPESYSIKSYIKSHDQSSDSNKSCSDIYINPSINNSEFFIVTKKDDFESLVRKRYTVVLQNESPVDDGSMSVFASKFGKRYINAEAKMGRSDVQIKMLETLLADY